MTGVIFPTLYTCLGFAVVRCRTWVGPILPAALWVQSPPLFTQGSRHLIGEKFKVQLLLRLCHSSFMSLVWSQFGEALNVVQSLRWSYQCRKIRGFCLFCSGLESVWRTAVFLTREFPKSCTTSDTVRTTLRYIHEHLAGNAVNIITNAIVWFSQTWKRRDCLEVSECMLWEINTRLMCSSSRIRSCRQAINYFHAAVWRLSRRRGEGGYSRVLYGVRAHLHGAGERARR